MPIPRGPLVRPGRHAALRTALAVAVLIGAPSIAARLVPGPPRDGQPATLPPRVDLTSRAGPYSGRDFTPEHVDCTLAKAGRKDRLVLFGVREGVSEASFSLFGKRPTYVGVVDIEPGNEPLYVVLTSYSPMIWRFTGAVERVSRAVATSSVRDPFAAGSVTAAGVTGLPADKVSFLTGGACLVPFHDLDSGDEQRARLQFAKLLDRFPDVVGGTYAIDAVALPSGRLSKGAFATRTSVTQVDPSTVVSPASLVR